MNVDLNKTFESEFFNDFQTYKNGAQEKYQKVSILLLSLFFDAYLGIQNTFRFLTMFTLQQLWGAYA